MSMFTVIKRTSFKEMQDPDLTVRYPIVQFEEIVTVKAAYSTKENLFMVLGSGDREYLSPSWPVFDNLDDARDYRDITDQIDTLNKKIVELKITKGELTIKRPDSTRTFRSNKPVAHNYRKMEAFRASGKEEVLTLIK